MIGARSSLAAGAAALLAMMLPLLAGAGAGAGADPAPTAGADGVSSNTERGFAIFQSKCLSCHGNPAYERAPSPAALRQMTPEHIYDVLTNGVMYPVIGNQLSDADRKVAAEMISGHLMGSRKAVAELPNKCPAGASRSSADQGSNWDGWGGNTSNTRYQADPGSHLTAATVPKLKLKWAFGLPGSSSSYSQPTVVAGRVYFGTDTGTIYSVDAHSGCVYWSFQAQSGVRNALTVGPADGRSAVFFGDLKANVYALDAETGRQLWTMRAEDNYTDRVTASPQLYEGVLYTPISSFEEFAARSPNFSCCTSVGEIVAIEAATGRKIWNRYIIPERPQPVRKNKDGVQQYAPAGGSIWNTPAVDPIKGAIYFGTGDATTFPAAETTDAVMALALGDGKPLWSYQVQPKDSFLVGCWGDTVTDNCPKAEGPDWDISAAVILTTDKSGRRLALVATKPGDVVAVDPDHDGQVVWRMNVSGKLAVSAPASGGKPSYTGMFWGGATDAENVYYGLSGGGIVAIRLTDGHIAWRRELPPASGKTSSNATPVTEIAGLLLIGGSDGRLHALSSHDGAELWHDDTARSFETVDQVPAHGGSIVSPGPTVADDMVFVASGYSIVQSLTGNVVLAYGLE